MNAKKLTWNGKEYTTPQLAKALNAKPRTLYRRIADFGLDKAIEICQMSEAEYKQHRLSLCHEGNKESRPELWVYEYKGQMYSRKALANLLGVNTATFISWITRYGKENAIRLAETPVNLRKAEMQKIRSKTVKKAEPGERPSKMDEFEIPKLDPDYELKNRIKYWIRHYGMEGAIAKASLRI